MQTASPARAAFRFTGLSSAPFEHLYAMSDDELAAHQAKRTIVDSDRAYPDRIELRDGRIGESVLLVNHAHLPHPGPYRSSHAVYVIEGATRRFDAVCGVPDVLRSRMLSLRAFDRDEMMIDADLVAGSDAEALIERLFADRDVVFIHAHYARRGCYACRIERADA